MARIRTIKPEFWTHDEVTECSPVSRLLFIGMWNFADDGGVLPYRPKQIKGQVFPFDFSLDEVKEMIEDLVNNGLLERYEVDGKDYVRVKGWRHQKIDQPTYKHPTPDGKIPQNRRRSSDDSSANSEAGSTKDYKNSPNDSRTSTEGAPNDQQQDGERSPPEGKGCISTTQGNAPSRYVFEGRVIRLNQSDWDRWAEAFPLVDLRAECQSYDDWLQSEPEDGRKKWFNRLSAKLKSKNDELRSKQQPPKRKNPDRMVPEDWGVGVGNA